MDTLTNRDLGDENQPIDHKTAQQPLPPRQQYRVDASIDWCSTTIETDDLVVGARSRDEAMDMARKILDRQKRIEEAVDGGPPDWELYLDVELVEDAQAREAELQVPFEERSARNREQRLKFERAEFETWYAKEFPDMVKPFVRDTDPDNPDGYLEMHTQCVWLGWCAKVGL